MNIKNNKTHRVKGPSLSEEIWVLEFTQESAQEFRDRLIEESQENPNKPIIVYIDSYGGSVDALAKMIATIDEISNPIITACMGKAMSCGAILLSHGDVRFCDPHSRIMVHKVSASTSGDSEDITNDATEIARLNHYWLSFLADNCNVKGGYNELETQLKSRDGRDRYMTAQDAVAFGIVDIVGYPKINGVAVYEVISAPEKISLKQRAKLRLEYAKPKPKSKTKPKVKEVKNVRKSRKKLPTK